MTIDEYEERFRSPAPSWHQILKLNQSRQSTIQTRPARRGRAGVQPARVASTRRCWRMVSGDSAAFRNQKFADLYGSFSVKWFFGLCRFLVWSGKAVPRPVACDQVRGARGKVSRVRNASAA